MRAVQAQAQSNTSNAVECMYDGNRSACTLSQQYLHIGDQCCCLPCCPVRGQTGQFDQIAARIAAAVKLNCGQKAVLLAHSMGGNVVLHMLRQPRFRAWRCVLETWCVCRRQAFSITALASQGIALAAAQQQHCSVQGALSAVGAGTAACAGMCSSRTKPFSSSKGIRARQ